MWPSFCFCDLHEIRTFARGIGRQITNLGEKEKLFDRRGRTDGGLVAPWKVALRRWISVPSGDVPGISLHSESRTGCKRAIHSYSTIMLYDFLSCHVRQTLVPRPRHPRPPRPAVLGLSCLCYLCCLCFLSCLSCLSCLHPPSF